jgi:hypothetical protein
MNKFIVNFVSGLVAGTVIITFVYLTTGHLELWPSFIFTVIGGTLGAYLYEWLCPKKEDANVDER